MVITGVTLHPPLNVIKQPKQSTRTNKHRIALHSTRSAFHPFMSRRTILNISLAHSMDKQEHSTQRAARAWEFLAPRIHGRRRPRLEHPYIHHYHHRLQPESLPQRSNPISHRKPELRSIRRPSSTLPSPQSLPHLDSRLPLPINLSSRAASCVAPGPSIPRGKTARSARHPQRKSCAPGHHPLARLRRSPMVPSIHPNIRTDLNFQRAMYPQARLA